MKRTFGIITAIVACCINLSTAQQYTNLTPIQLTQYNIDSIKASMPDTQSLINCLQQIKEKTEQDIQHINVALQQTETEKKNTLQQKKLLQTKRQIINAQKEQLQQEENNRTKEIKLIQKALEQIDNNTDTTQFAYQQTLIARTNTLNNSQINSTNKKNELLAKENQLFNEEIILKHKEIEIQSHLFNLKQQMKTTKIKINHLTTEINYQKNKL